MKEGNTVISQYGINSVTAYMTFCLVMITDFTPHHDTPSTPSIFQCDTVLHAYATPATEHQYSLNGTGIRQSIAQHANVGIFNDDTFLPNVSLISMSISEDRSNTRSALISEGRSNMRSVLISEGRSNMRSVLISEGRSNMRSVLISEGRSNMRSVLISEGRSNMRSVLIIEGRSNTRSVLISEGRSNTRSVLISEGRSNMRSVFCGMIVEWCDDSTRNADLKHA